MSQWIKMIASKADGQPEFDPRATGQERADSQKLSTDLHIQIN